MPASADTMLRIVRAETPPVGPTPRVLGVDDWAWRKGQRYGTVLVDLEAHCIVDLLPDRETATLADWLTEHPGVEIIARDRAGAYARGAREGAPNARQVADRWHLLRNCSDALLNVVERRYRVVREVGKSLAIQNTTPSSCISGALQRKKTERLASERRQARRSVFDKVVELRRLGWSQLAIHRELGVDLKTIRKWLQDKSPGTWQRTMYKAHPAEPFEIYLRQRWDEGCRNATQLYREVCEHGYQGNPRNFRQWVKVRLRDDMPSPNGNPVKSRSPWRPPLSRQTTRLLTVDAGMLPQRERAYVDALCAASPDIAQAASLARRFQTMIKERKEDALAGWLNDALASPLAPIARGLSRDIEAVNAALTLPWSTGPVEGKINKLKLIKRSMYGRAGLDLLRARVMET